MKVKELIEELQKFDPEADVLRQVGDFEDDIFQVFTSTMYGRNDVIIY